MVINLLIAGILFFLEKKYSKFFLINAVISAIVINHLFLFLSRAKSDKKLSDKIDTNPSTPYTI